MRSAALAATAVAFAGLAFPNPFPFLLVAGAVVLVGAWLDERRREGQG